MITPLANLPALKMNGLGNEIVVLDLRGVDHLVTPAEARAIGSAPGLHFDQLMVLHPPRTAGTEAFVLIHNIDGSEAGACGNGTRCVAWHLTQVSDAARFAVETRAGILSCERLGPLTFAVDMGVPQLGWRDIPLAAAVADTTRVPLDTAFLDARFPTDFTGVGMGNPHAVFFVDDVEALELVRTGPLLETHPMFPQKANISLAAVTSSSGLTLKVWERGAGLTRACGSGACAAAVAAHRRGLTGRKVAVSLPGGVLDIFWREDGGVVMTGPVEFERELRLSPAFFEAAACGEAI
jgi:diaminopimelate epimerase